MSTLSAIVPSIITEALWLYPEKHNVAAQPLLTLFAVRRLHHGLVWDFTLRCA